MKLSAMVVAMVILVGSATVATAKEVQVKEYTRKDGTVVKAHTKTVKDKEEKKADTQEVKGYTKNDGTVVKGYTRKKAPEKGEKKAEEKKKS